MGQHPIARWRALSPPISRTRLAREVGISQPALLEIERGTTNPSADTIRQLVTATEALRPGRGLTAGQILGTEPFQADEDEDAASEAAA